MSLQAEQQRSARQHWALPGGSHDRLVTFLKGALPVGIGVLSAFLAVAQPAHQAARMHGIAQHQQQAGRQLRIGRKARHLPGRVGFEAHIGDPGLGRLRRER